METPALNDEAPVMNLLRSRQGGGPAVAQLRVISDIAALEKLATLGGMLAGASSVDLELPGMGQEELSHWQAMINRQLAACGCKEGGIFLVTSLAVYGPYLLLHPQGLALSGWAKLGYGLGIAFVAGAAGKVIGLLRARKLLKRIISRLKIEYGLKAI
jgi:hypothetical protein